MIKKEVKNQRKKLQKLELENDKTLKNTKRKKQFKKVEGITLIALIITIIILIILAGITLVALSGENGILKQATKAKDETGRAEIVEEIRLEIYDEMIDNRGKKPTESDIERIADKYGDIEGENFTDKVLITEKGKYEIKLSEIWVESEKKGVSIGEIFDPTGEEEGKLHVGDFVNYTAGNWTEEDMKKIETSGAKIAANNSTDLPTKAFEFGGFTVGTSKDGNATPHTTAYNYVKDKETGEGITGWRVFDVDEEGRLILISSGCPEDYYHSYNYGRSSHAYTSEYILSGNINGSADAASLGLGTTYTPRDWSMYVNPKYEDATATTLTKTRLDEWYTKYITEGTVADTYLSATFQKIYNTNYESLVDNYSYHFIATAYSSYGSYGMCAINPIVKEMYVPGSSAAFGVRVLISLPSNIQIEKESAGTKTVVSRDSEYTYNVWNLQ